MQSEQQVKIKSRLYIHRLLPIITIIWWLSLSTSASACACGRGPDDSVSLRYKGTQIVFVAWVKAILTTEPPIKQDSKSVIVAGFERRSAKLAVEEIFKGVIGSDELMPLDASTCGVPFEAGK